MKKTILLSICFLLSYSLQAQRSLSKFYYADSLLPRFCIDINEKGGFLAQNMTTANLANAYANVLNDTIGKLKFNNGTSLGFDVQLAYFLGKKRHFGIGTGFIYLSQKGDITLDRFHLEYKSIDYANDTFRQLLTANNAINETITITNINIPLLLKYKKQFSARFGFSMDAGVLFNLQMKNAYNTNASFDYEAIYKLNQVGSTAVSEYDYSPIPNTNDWLITRNQVTQDIKGGNVPAYFDSLKAQGFNVGLNQHPNSNSGNVTYKVTIGFLAQPSLSFRVNDYFFIHFGGYYMLQQMSNSPSANYQLTGKVGEYSSLMNSVSKSYNSSYGLNLGVRIYIDDDLLHLNGFHRAKRRKEYTPQVTESPAPVIEQHKIVVKEEQAPVKTKELPVSAVFFASGNEHVSKEAAQSLDKVATFMWENPETELQIVGYTDNTGFEKNNLHLSIDRAMSVKKYLVGKGVAGNRLSIKGAGADDPVADNSSKEGRAQNRRTVLSIKVK